MEDEDNVEDRLQCQLAGLSLSSTEKPPYYQRRDITPSLHDKFCSPGGEAAFLGQGMLVFSDVLIPQFEMKSLYKSMARYTLK